MRDVVRVRTSRSGASRGMLVWLDARAIGAHPGDVSGKTTRVASVVRQSQGALNQRTAA